MPVIHVNNKQYTLKIGTSLVGAGDSADVPVPVHDGVGVQAVVEVESGASASIRRASPSAVVRVNGVALGIEPIPLLHGDRVEIAGHELLFAEDHRGGATQYLPARDASGTAPSYTPAEGATARTGGRLVSLVDGREYPIAATGFVIGRDAGCDVVVPSAEVSRRHAEIVPAQSGYVLTDLSTNGIFVNGDRVKYSILLGRGDIIRLGSDEFRFDADDAGVERPIRSVRPAPVAAGTPTLARWPRTALIALVVVALVGAIAFFALG